MQGEQHFENSKSGFTSTLWRPIMMQKKKSIYIYMYEVALIFFLVSVIRMWAWNFKPQKNNRRRRLCQEWWPSCQREIWVAVFNAASVQSALTTYTQTALLHRTTKTHSELTKHRTASPGLLNLPWRLHPGPPLSTEENFLAGPRLPLIY